MKNHSFVLNIADFVAVNNSVNIYWTDTQNRFVYSNDHLVKMLGELSNAKSIDEYINKPLRDVLPHNWIDVVYAENNLVLETRKVHQFLNKALFLDNRCIVFITTKMPYYDNDNQLAGVFGISHLIADYNIEAIKHTSLTPRECDCIALLIKGKTAAEIAKLLDISARTVESYLNNAKIKLQCDTKSTLIEKAYELGLSTLTTETTSEPFEQGIFLPKDRKDK